MTNERKKMISLIPGGTIQFYEFSFDIRKLKKPDIRFFEHETDNATNSTSKWKIHFLNKDENSDYFIDRQTDKIFVNPITDEPVSDQSELLSINYEYALETFLNKWVPLPFFRGADDISLNEKRYRFGPTDWCRIRITKIIGDIEFTHKAVLAFDTHVQSEIDVINASAEHGYPALATSDVNEAGDFAFVSNILHNSWFLRLDWLNAWLEEFYTKYKHGTKAKPTDYHSEHIARYVTLLELLNETNLVPNVKLIDPKRYDPINVDLVLDIGNARTIGMLIERNSEQSLNLSNGSKLEIRDLTNPELIYQNTFSSYVTFSEPNFGDPNSHARGAGRIRPSFSWPSVVRVGDEAVKLSAQSRRDQGQTSMSSPKRYLWDLKPRPSGEEWRFSTDPSDTISPQKPVNMGEFVGYVNNDGIPLDIQNPNRYPNATLLKTTNIFPVTEPRFSRSSMMMFLMSEIIAHALVQLNSPAKRSERQNPDIPRRLSRIILTTPPAMSIAEKNMFESWANWAVDIIWKTLEWEQFGEKLKEYRQRPKIHFNLDEASATQLVFIYNEIDSKFSGVAKDFFKIYGQIRHGENIESLRVASIDIGGGTTDMVITTYLNKSENVTSILEPKQEFRESFNFAGDDILKAVIENHIIPEIIQQFSPSRKTIVKSEVDKKFKDAVGVPEREKNIRSQLTQQFLLPLALKIIQTMEGINPIHMDVIPITVDLDELFGNNYPSDEILSYLEDIFSKFNQANFTFKSKVINFDAKAIERTINASIGPYLNDLAEIVEKFQCDFLILSGRPSCLPNIQTMFKKRPPTELSRIISMGDYKVDNWYPFVTAANKIGDPKATAVVGALLSAISEGNLLNFHIKASKLKPASTIRHIGPMDTNRQIRNENLFFNAANISKSNDEEFRHIFKFASQVYIGFRQFPIERWKTTPFYFLCFNSDAAKERSAKHGVPYNVSFVYTHKDELDDGHDGNFERDGVLKIEEIFAADGTAIPRGDIEVQPKSLWEEKGHWLDTGLFDLSNIEIL